MRDTHCITFFTLLLASLGLARFLPLFFIGLPLPLLLPLPFIYSSFYLLRSNTFYTCLHGSTPPALGINTDKYLCVCVCVCFPNCHAADLTDRRRLLLLCCSGCFCRARSLSILLPYTHTHTLCSLALYVARVVSYVDVVVATHSPVTSFVEQCGSEFNLLYLRWPHRRPDSQTDPETDRTRKVNGSLLSPALPLSRTLHTARNP